MTGGGQPTSFYECFDHLLLSWEWLKILWHLLNVCSTNKLFQRSCISKCKYIYTVKLWMDSILNILLDVCIFRKHTFKQLAPEFPWSSKFKEEKTRCKIKLKNRNTIGQIKLFTSMIIWMYFFLFMKTNSPVNVLPDGFGNYTPVRATPPYSHPNQIKLGSWNV